MNRFLNNTKQERVVVPRIATFKEFFPAGAPIIDFLTVYNSLQNWSKKRSITKMDVEVREIYVGTSSEDKVKQFANWVNERYRMDHQEFPSGVISIRDKLRMA